MSEEVAVSKETEAAANVEAQGDEVSAAEVNARLLAESKKNKKLAQEYRSKLETLEKTKLEEQSQYKELYQKSEEKYQGLYKSLVREKIKTAVSERASKHGAIDVEAVLKLGNAELLQVDQESLEVHGVDEFVEELKKSKQYLFQPVKTPTINPATPGGVVRGQTKSLQQMSAAEIMAELHKLPKG